MKTLLTLITLAFGVSATAGNFIDRKTDLRLFTGKFDLVENKCDAFSGTVGYGKIRRDVDNNVTGYMLSVYGNDPSGDGLMIGTQEEENPNYPSNPIKTVSRLGYTKKNVWINSVTYTYGNGTREHAYIKRVVASKEGLRYEEVEPATKKTKEKVTSSCEFTRAKDSR